MLGHVVYAVVNADWQHEQILTSPNPDLPVHLQLPLREDALFWPLGCYEDERPIHEGGPYELIVGALHIQDTWNLTFRSRRWPLPPCWSCPRNMTDQKAGGHTVTVGQAFPGITRDTITQYIRRARGCCAAHVPAALTKQYASDRSGSDRCRLYEAEIRRSGGRTDRATDGKRPLTEELIR